MTARAAEQPGLNAKDMKIVQAVIRNPRASVEEISKDTSVPRPTVQRRLGHLFDQGFLERSIHVVDWSAMFPLRYWVEVKVNVRQLQLGRGGRVGERRRVCSQNALASSTLDTLPSRHKC